MKNQSLPEGPILRDSARLAFPLTLIDMTAEQHASDGTAIALSALGNARNSVGLFESIHTALMTVGMRELLVV
jgi:hypothetical protein